MRTMPKFKYGDAVEVNGHTGTIRRITKKANGNYIYNVHFDNSNLIPPHMDFPESHINHYNGGNKKYQYDGRFSYKNLMYSKDRCPICSTEWHRVEHPIHGKKEIWEDCLKCNKTKEDIMETKNIYHNYD